MIRHVSIALFAGILLAGCQTPGTGSSLVGLNERTHTARIQEFIGVNPRYSPWCGYFAAAVIRERGGTPPSGYPRARAWLNYGRSIPARQARAGDIVVVGRHVSIVTSVTSDRINVISGNFSNSVQRHSYGFGQVRVRRG
jgi:hypothetical protein